MVARRAHNPEAAGSNPVPATKKSTRSQNGFGFSNALKTAVFNTYSDFLKLIRCLYLNAEEKKIIVQSRIELKNDLIRQGRYTDPVDELLIKVLSI